MMGDVIEAFIVGIVVAVLASVIAIWCWNRVFSGTKWALNFRRHNCPRCGNRLPMMRVPRSRRQALWGGATCGKCGCEIDKHGKEIAAETH